MTYKTSLSKTRLFSQYFKKGLFINSIKRFWWVSLLYSIALFFSTPLQLLMNFSVQKATNPVEIKALQASAERAMFDPSGFSFLSIAMLIVVPVVLAILIFRYMQKNKSTAIIHSLPCTRRQLYWSFTVSGLVLLFIPVILNMLILFAFNSFTHLGIYLTSTIIMKWVGYTLLYQLIFYSSAVFVGMFTGNSGAQLIFTFILHLLIPGFMELWNYFMLSILKGYAISAVNNLWSQFPINSLLQNKYNYTLFDSIQILIYFILSVLLLVSAEFIYKFKKAETAGEIIAFPIISIIFKYGVAICLAFLVGTCIVIDGFSGIVIGFIIGSFIGYWMAEMVIRKSLAVWKAYKGYLILLSILVLFLVGLKLDVLGYVHKVPNVNQVEAAYIGWDAEQIMISENGQYTVAQNIHYSGTAKLTEPANIKSVIELQSQLIQSASPSRSIGKRIIYKLKNGSQIIRTYVFLEQDYAKYLAPIYNSLEYKKSSNVMLSIKPETITSINLHDSRMGQFPAVISNKDEIYQFIKAFQEDVIREPIEPWKIEEDAILVEVNYIIKKPNNSTQNDVSDESKVTNTYIMPLNYKLTIEWLKSKGYYEKIIITEKDVDHVLLHKTTYKTDSHSNTVTNEDPSQTTEIRDKEVIKYLLENNIKDKLPKQNPNSVTAGRLEFIFKPGYNTYQQYVYSDTEPYEKLMSYFNKDK